MSDASVKLGVLKLRLTAIGAEIKLAISFSLQSFVAFFYSLEKCRIFRQITNNLNFFTLFAMRSSFFFGAIK